MKKLVSLAFIFLCLMVSCKKSDNPVSTPPQQTYRSLPASAMAIYTGDLAYAANVVVAEAATAKATITKVGDSYTITFSNAQLPVDKRTITGIKFIEDAPGHFTSAVINGIGGAWGNILVSGIVWTNEELDISLSSSNPFFTFGYSGIK
jgi:hypothetical protein